MKLLAILVAALIATPCLPAQQTAAKFVLEADTPVKLVLGETISSADERVGNVVNFEVVEDVTVNNVVVIPRGSEAWATVTAAEPKKILGRGGKLDINIDKVRLSDSERVLLQAVQGGKGGEHQGAMVETNLIIWAVAPSSQSMRGKDVSIAKGTPITAFVEGDAVLDPAKFTPEALNPNAVPQPAPQARAAADNSPAYGQMIDVAPKQVSLGDYARKLKQQKATTNTPSR